MRQSLSVNGAKLTHYTLVSEADTSGQHTGDSSTSCNPGLDGACYHKEFLCSGYGVAMQGTGVASNGKVIRYVSGGGGWSSGYAWLNDCASATFSVTDAARGASGRVLSADWSVAVDPSVIPLGSYLWIDSQDHWFRADDTGGAIAGTHIDVFMGDTGWVLGSGSSDLLIESDGIFRGHGAPGPNQQSSCDRIGVGGATIGESSPCFTVSGNHLAWHSERYGHEENLIWTNTVSGSSENVGSWKLGFEASGEYDLEIFIPEKFAASRQALYRVFHAGGTAEVSVDQSAEQGFVSLGRFMFEAGSDYSVELSDATGESGETLAFDTLRLTPAGQNPFPDPDSDSDSDPDPDPDPGFASDLTGGCQAAGQGTGISWLCFLLLFIVRRRNP